MGSAPRTVCSSSPWSVSCTVHSQAVFSSLPLGPQLFSLFTGSCRPQTCSDLESVTPIYFSCGHLLPELWPSYLPASQNLPPDSSLSLYFTEHFKKVLSLLKLAKNKKEQNTSREIHVTSLAFDCGSGNQRYPVGHLLFITFDQFNPSIYLTEQNLLFTLNYFVKHGMLAP